MSNCDSNLAVCCFISKFWAPREKNWILCHRQRIYCNDLEETKRDKNRKQNNTALWLWELCRACNSRCKSPDLRYYRIKIFHHGIWLFITIHYHYFIHYSFIYSWLFIHSMLIHLCWLVGYYCVEWNTEKDRNNCNFLGAALRPATVSASVLKKEAQRMCIFAWCDFIWCQIELLFKSKSFIRILHLKAASK